MIFKALVVYVAVSLGSAGYAGVRFVGFIVVAGGEKLCTAVLFDQHAKGERVDLLFHTLPSTKIVFGSEFHVNTTKL